MTQQETLYSIALTCVPSLSLANMKLLTDEMGSSTAVFENRHQLQDILPSATKHMLESIASMDQHLARAEQEMEFAEKGHIQILGIHDEAYPQALADCLDAPIVLYYRGKAPLNARHIVSMVGTRQITDYGKDFCQRFVRELKNLCPDVMIVSGLAYGVDIHSHRAALQNGLPTVGVVAHGLDQIYPRSHRNTAVEMVNNGGILTEYMSYTAIDKRNFVQRNRIVAGMSSATIVVESADKGGSLITAGIADSYDREVFAVPGRISDTYSAGCNHLIHDNRAVMLESAPQFAEHMGWVSEEQKRKALSDGIQQELFPDLTSEEQRVVDSMQKGENMQINILVNKTGFSISQVSSLLFSLEMKGAVKPVVGGCYRLL